MFTSGWGSTSVFTSGGGSTSVFTSGGSTFMFTSGGIHFCLHLWGGPLPCSLLGVPCDLSHNTLIYCYIMPQCIMGKIHMGPPPELDTQTDRKTRLKTLPSHTLHMRAVKIVQFVILVENHAYFVGNYAAEVRILGVGEGLQLCFRILTAV